jgi:hypothetical protein
MSEYRTQTLELAAQEAEIRRQAAESSVSPELGIISLGQTVELQAPESDTLVENFELAKTEGVTAEALAEMAELRALEQLRNGAMGQIAAAEAFRYQ